MVALFVIGTKALLPLLSANLHRAWQVTKM
jgi:hypothetical protein